MSKITEKSKIVIIGSKDLGQLIAQHIITDSKAQIAGFFDDFQAPGTDTPFGPVLGPIEEFESRYEKNEFNSFLLGIGYKHFNFRQEIFERLSKIAPAATFIHSSCYVDPSCKVGAGSFLLPGCVIDAGSSLGENVLLNTGCTIAHDTQIGSHTFLSPGVTLAGFISIGSKCFLGLGTSVIDNVNIADQVQTGAGAVVTESLQNPGLYLGIPAKLKAA